jgi:hypothetical protein
MKHFIKILFLICLVLQLFSPYVVSAAPTTQMKLPSQDSGPWTSPEFQQREPELGEGEPFGITTGVRKAEPWIDTSLGGEEDPSKGGLIPTTEAQKQQDISQSPFAEVLSCSVGALLANVLTALITAAINFILGIFTKAEVPTEPVQITKKDVGLTIFGIPIFPSWDSIAYCLANALIIFVADSTIAWIQSGFEGKPVFVDDPTKFFKNLADYEMSNFLENFMGGMLCEPFEIGVTVGLVENYVNYGNSLSTAPSCTLDTVKHNVDDFVNGRTFSFDVLTQMGTNPLNTPAGSYQHARDAARNFIELRAGPVKTEVDWGGGWLSWKIKDGPQAGKTVTPGIVVSEQLNKRLGMSTDRLVLAEKFDQVIAALVNYLIKAALSELVNAF